MDLCNQISELINKLNLSIKSLSRNGRTLAEAERDYKITLRKEALKLRSEKNMPVTLISQIIYGVPEVADKRFKRDIAETMYQTNLEFINTTKLQLRLLENQLSREWNSNEKV